MTIPADVRRRQRQLARWVRRAPGYRTAVRQILPRVRRSTVLNDLAWRVFAPGRQLPGEVVVPLRDSVHLTGADVHRLPVVGVVALGADHGQLLTLMDQLADVQRRTRGFRPLLIADTPTFAEARTHGYVVDLLVPEAGWAGPEGAWADYVGQRVVSATYAYQLWSLLTVQPTGLSAVDVAVLEQLAARLPEDRDVHATAAQA